MENKKHLYLLMANHGVYLPYHVLEQAYTMLKELVKTEGYLSAINLVEDCYAKKKKYNDPNRGAYVINNIHKEYTKGLGKKIVAKDLNGNVRLEFNSIYQASMHILENRSGAGNISQAVNGKKHTAYGYIWQEK